MQVLRKASQKRLPCQCTRKGRLPEGRDGPQPRWRSWLSKGTRTEGTRRWPGRGGASGGRRGV